MKRALISLIICILLTGCWSSKELGESAFVAAVAIEKEGDLYTPKLQFLQPVKLEQGATDAHIMIASEGLSAHQSLRSAIKGVHRRIYLSHAQTFVVSTEIAKEGIFPALDIIYRDQMFRLTSYLFIADQPGTLLALPSPVDPLTGISLANGIEAAEDSHQRVITTTLKEFMEMSYEPGGCAYVIRLKKHADENQKEPHIDLDGTAILKEGIYVKDINDILADALRYYRNEAGNDTFTMQVPDGDDWFALERLQARTSIHTRLQNNELIIDVSVNTDANINEWHSSTELDGLMFKKIGKAYSEELQARMEKLLAKMREEPVTDILGFGTEVRRQLPTYWKQVQDNWDTAFKTAKVNITVETNIENFNLIENTNREPNQGPPKRFQLPWIKN
ncbi:Ger(x)C family spore germination protein [Alkalihalobacterium chitinilyticum]|uniref:Ger(X)C family spore germination protein n=1 Tax=Alkalihalobacterium chitinilyticum TaxID=2980103 RepID=A0ABT5VG82_9BACI|nr:Ger(x)C family spore germination protein [Alkalihalobacterium chitinilyticum]MDE5414469.1 Ger(x)C family spore germination protein [Alkalihalobacterium chitinilyticum]